MYYSTDAGDSWLPYSNGLPGVPVIHLKIFPPIGLNGQEAADTASWGDNRRFLRASTYGRGLFERSLAPDFDNSDSMIYIRRSKWDRGYYDVQAPLFNSQSPDVKISIPNCGAEYPYPTEPDFYQFSLLANGMEFDSKSQMSITEIRMGTLDTPPVGKKIIYNGITKWLYKQTNSSVQLPESFRIYTQIHNRGQSWPEKLQVYLLACVEDKATLPDLPSGYPGTLKTLSVNSMLGEWKLLGKKNDLALSNKEQGIPYIAGFDLQKSDLPKSKTLKKSIPVEGNKIKLLVLIDSASDGLEGKETNVKTLCTTNRRASLSNIYRSYMIDHRDDKIYPTVEFSIDGKKQVWIVENLAYYDDTIKDESWVYDQKNSDSYNQTNLEKYGRLYSWEGAQKACPPNWQLPSDDDWKNIALKFGGYYDIQTGKDIGKKPDDAYKALLTGGDSDFAALLGGLRNLDGKYGYIKTGNLYWSGTSLKGDSSMAWWYGFGPKGFSNVHIVSRYFNTKGWGSSVRCVRTYIVDPRDQRTYLTVTFEINGKKQTWMAENLAYYDDTLKGKSWIYDQDPANLEKYGRLYTWEAANNLAKGLGSGWRLPTDDDWKNLALLFGGYNEYSDNHNFGNNISGAYLALMENGSSGFNARLGGYWDGNTFHFIGKYGDYWSSVKNPNDSGEALHYVFSTVITGIERKTKESLNYGLSVRYVKDE